MMRCQTPRLARAASSALQFLYQEVVKAREYTSSLLRGPREFLVAVRGPGQTIGEMALLGSLDGANSGDASSKPAAGSSDKSTGGSSSGSGKGGGGNEDGSSGSSMTGGRRCASVRAQSPMSVAVVPWAHFQRVCAAHPEVSVVILFIFFPDVHCGVAGGKLPARLRRPPGAESLTVVESQPLCVDKSAPMVAPAAARESYIQQRGLLHLHFGLFQFRLRQTSQVRQQVREAAWARKSENTVLEALILLAALHEPLRAALSNQAAAARRHSHHIADAPRWQI